MKRWPILFLFVAFALGQAPSKGKAAPAPAPSPVVTDELTAYLIPDAEQNKILRLQREWAEREAAIQTMQVTIEKNRAQQTAISEQIRLLSYQFAQSKQIDLKLWEIDPEALKFVKKKAAAK
jgi:hypothetical protein